MPPSGIRQADQPHGLDPFRWVGGGRALEVESGQGDVHLEVVVPLVLVVGGADHRRPVADVLVPAHGALEPDREPIEGGVARVDLDGSRPGSDRPGPGKRAGSPSPPTSASPDGPGPGGEPSGKFRGPGSRFRTGSPVHSGRRRAWPGLVVAAGPRSPAGEVAGAAGKPGTDIRPSWSISRSVSVDPVSSRYGAKKRSIVRRSLPGRTASGPVTCPSGAGELDAVALR